MTAAEIERWCREGHGGTIARTLLLPLSYPRAWAPGPAPVAADPPVAHATALDAAIEVRERLGHPVAIGFVVVASHPTEPIAHAFNATSGVAVDDVLADRSPLVYWGYLPTADQLEVDRLMLTAEAPPLAQLIAIAGG